MGLPSFLRSLIGPDRFPQLEGQDLPDSVNTPPAAVLPDNPANRVATQERILKTPAASPELPTP